MDIIFNDKTVLSKYKIPSFVLLILLVIWFIWLSQFKYLFIMMPKK